MVSLFFLPKYDFLTVSGRSRKIYPLSALRQCPGLYGSDVCSYAGKGVISKSSRPEGQGPGLGVFELFVALVLGD